MENPLCEIRRKNPRNDNDYVRQIYNRTRPFGAYLLEREIVKNKYVKGRTPFFHIKIGNTVSNSVFESAPFPKTQSINCWVRGSEKDFIITE